MRAFVGLSILLISIPAHSHEAYSNLRDAAGHVCCGDADCEPVDDFAVHRDGSVSFVSRRYKTTITVPAERVTRVSLPGAPAHWCGAERLDWTAEELDNSFITFCAFVAPDGS